MPIGKSRPTSLNRELINSNSYNADFDGDEMNIHFPRTYRILH